MQLFLNGQSDADANATSTAKHQTTVSDVQQVTTVTTQTTATATTTSSKAVQYTDYDLYCLAVVIQREAGYSFCSDEEQIMVASVVMNRVDSDLYPDTIHNVLTQHRQYGMMWKYGIKFSDSADKESIDRAYKNAKIVLDGYRNCPKNVVFQSEFKQGSGVYKRISKTYFCYL